MSAHSLSEHWWEHAERLAGEGREGEALDWAIAAGAEAEVEGVWLADVPTTNASAALIAAWRKGWKRQHESFVRRAIRLVKEFWREQP